MDTLCLVIIAIVVLLLLLFIYANTPTSWTFKHKIPPVAYLKRAKLIQIFDENNMNRADTTIVHGEELLSRPTLVMAVRRPGCPFCRRESAHLSTLRPLLDKAGVHLVAVTYQSKGANDFKPFFNGDVYLDTERTFYGPHERYMPIWRGLMRVRLLKTYLQTKMEGITGNLLVGDGRLLGAVFFVSGDEMVWAHMEKEWGDTFKIEELRAVIVDWMEKNKRTLVEPTEKMTLIS